MRGRQGRHAAWLLLGCLLLPARARASYEEFSTVNVGRTEEDDEYLFDSELVRSPFYWHDEYDHATSAFRSVASVSSGESGMADILGAIEDILLFLTELRDLKLCKKKQNVLNCS